MSSWKSDAGRSQVHAACRALLDQWPLATRRHELPTCQGTTFVLECGRADGPPVVLLHGSMSTSLSWLNEMRLMRGRFRMLAVDMIGEPGPSADVRPALDSDAHAAWLDDVFDGLGIAAAAIVGISLGGWLGLDYTVRRPQRVEQLALIVPGGIGKQKNILPWALPMMLLGKWGQRKVAERILGPEPADVDTLTREFLDLQALIARHFRPRRVVLPRVSDAQLQAIDIPVMAVVAGRDVMLDPHTMRQRLERNVPDLRLHFLPEARHFPGDQSERIACFLDAP